jgi:hypothetical protein
LACIRPPEHVAGAIVEAVAVVLLVPFAGGLDLAGTRDRPRLAPELLLCRAAGDVETVRQLALEPVVIRRVGLDGQFAHQRVAVQGGHLVTRAVPHPEVHQATAELGLVDPLGDLGIVVIGNQQRQAEVAQQTFGSTFPVALVVAHLQQFAGKGHPLFGQRQGLGEGRAHQNLLGRDVAAPGLQAADLGRQLGVFLLTLAQADAQFGQVVLQARFASARRFGERRQALSLVEEGRLVLGRILANGAQQIGTPLRPARTHLALVFQPADLGRQALQPIAAVLGDVAAKFRFLDALRVTLIGVAPELRVLPPPLLRQSGEPLVEQANLETREVGLERFPAGAQFLDLSDHRRMPLAVGHQRREHGYLALGLQYRLVGAVEVVEVANQRGDARRHVERLEHVATHEVGEVADRLHRHRLVEEVERLLVVDGRSAAGTRPKRTAESCRRDLIRHRSPCSRLRSAPMSLPKWRKSRSAMDRSLFGGQEEDGPGCPCCILDPEDLRQRYRAGRSRRCGRRRGSPSSCCGRAVPPAALRCR